MRDLQVVVDSLTGLIRQLELDWSPGLLLPHRGTVHRITVRGNVLDLDSHDIAAAKLAIDGQIKKGEVTYSSLYQQSSSDRPNMLWPRGRSCPY
jgi:hypothetical protein